MSALHPIRAAVPNPLPRPDPSADAGSLQAWGDFLRRRALVIAATTLAVLAATVTTLQLLPPHYVARTDVLLDPRRSKAFGPDDVAAATANLDAASVDSAVAEIRGNGVLTRVVRSEGLPPTPASTARVAARAASCVASAPCWVAGAHVRPARNAMRSGPCSAP